MAWYGLSSGSAWHQIINDVIGASDWHHLMKSVGVYHEPDRSPGIISRVVLIDVAPASFEQHRHAGIDHAIHGLKPVAPLANHADLGQAL